MLFASGKPIVRKRRVRADEHVVLDSQAVPELNAAFDRDPIAHHDVVLDEDMIADVAVAADARAAEQVRKGPDAGAVADVDAVAQRLRMNEGRQRRSPAGTGRGAGPNVVTDCAMWDGRPLVFSKIRHT